MHHIQDVIVGILFGWVTFPTFVWPLIKKIWGTTFGKLFEKK